MRSRRPICPVQLVSVLLCLALAVSPSVSALQGNGNGAR
jgi:hypothetical protein